MKLGKFLLFSSFRCCRSPQEMYYTSAAKLCNTIFPYLPQFNTMRMVQKYPRMSIYICIHIPITNHYMLYWAKMLYWALCILSELRIEYLWISSSMIMSASHLHHASCHATHANKIMWYLRMCHRTRSDCTKFTLSCLTLLTTSRLMRPAFAVRSMLCFCWPSKHVCRKCLKFVYLPVCM